MSSHPAVDHSEPVKILIVDDEATKLLSLRAVLEDMGPQIVTASSGRDALRILLHEEFALILLDVNMPEFDGFETAALIRQRKRTEHVPVIFITSYDDDARQLQSYTHGAVDYLITPFVPEILRAKVRVFVELYRMQREIHRRAEERVALAQEQTARLAAEKANRTKSEFLANISHELRTPMNAIIGMTHLALEERISEEARDYLLTAQTSAQTLLGLLNEILDVSRLESGTVVLERLPLDVGNLVAETVKGLSVKAFERGIECSYFVDDDVPRGLSGDPLRLRQILTNLLGNAIKFTHVGEVAVRVSLANQADDIATLQFTVMDTGIGISNTDQQRVFAPFTQADSSMTRRYGGTGLGLAIAADLVKLMNGRIWVESEVGKGTRFDFTAEFHSVSPALISHPATHPAPCRDRALPVLDCSSQHRLLLEKTLRQIGIEPRLTGNAQDLASLLESAAADNPWPVFLITWPNGDAEIRGVIDRILAERLARQILLLISPLDRQKHAVWLGERRSIHCLEKPATPAELRRSIAALESIPEGHSWDIARNVNSESRQQLEGSLRILLVEDTPANQKFLSTILRKRGHAVSLANNGRDAIDMTAAQEFDVILMDVQMPVMDGLQATAEIRGRKGNGERTPIVAMTAHAMEGDRERFLAAGMDHYFAKPINLPELLEYLESRSQAIATGA